jgi:hypothetical protein
MAFAKSGTRFRFAQGLDGMHRLGVHPMRTPSAGMSSLFRQDYPARCRRVGDNVYAVFRLRYPSQEKTRPTVVVHRFRGTAWWDSNFEHAYKFIFENYFVTIRGSLHGIEAVGET